MNNKNGKKEGRKRRDMGEQKTGRRERIKWVRDQMSKVEERKRGGIERTRDWKKRKVKRKIKKR